MVVVGDGLPTPPPVSLELPVAVVVDEAPPASPIAPEPTVVLKVAAEEATIVEPDRTVHHCFARTGKRLWLAPKMRAKSAFVRTAVEPLLPTDEADASMFIIARRTHDEATSVEILARRCVVFDTKKFLYEPLFTFPSSRAHNTPPPTKSQHLLKSASPAPRVVSDLATRMFNFHEFESLATRRSSSNCPARLVIVQFVRLTDIEILDPLEDSSGLGAEMWQQITKLQRRKAGISTTSKSDRLD